MGMDIVDGMGQFWGKRGAYHCNQRGLCCVRGSDAALPKLLWGLLFSLVFGSWFTPRRI